MIMEEFFPRRAVDQAFEDLQIYRQGFWVLENFFQFLLLVLNKELCE